jgi:hypothetical protein
MGPPTSNLRDEDAFKCQYYSRFQFVHTIIVSQLPMPRTTNISSEIPSDCDDILRKTLTRRRQRYTNDRLQYIQQYGSRRKILV